MKLQLPKYNNPFWVAHVIALLIISLVAPASISRYFVWWALAALIVKSILFLGHVVEDDPFDSAYEEEERVDPWATQALLMKISNQGMPSMPWVSNESVLYSALIMEEAGETFEALAAALHRFYGPCPDTGDDETHPAARIAEHLALTAAYLTVKSQKIRELLKGTRISFTPRMQEAVAMLDGTTDIAVVNAGFALAAGLPGAAAYVEVAGSNLSKANPLTGMIEKDDSGKWLKGSDYYTPDLERVLRESTP